MAGLENRLLSQLEAVAALKPEDLIYVAQDGQPRKATLADLLVLTAQGLGIDDLKALSELLATTAYYGLGWDETTDTYEVLGSSAKHLELPIQRRMRRCLLNDAGGVTAYLDGGNSAYLANGDPASLAGGAGQVMVEIPRFWHRCFSVAGWHYWLIAETPLEGFSLHPAFHKDGQDVAYRYLGAYEGVVAGGKLCSVSGVEPKRGVNRAQFRAAAAARGAGWRVTDFTLRMAVGLLALVEYKSFDFKNASRMTAGRTTLSGGTWTLGSYIANTGLSNGLGNGTGGVSKGGSAGYLTDFMSYRGIENYFGHIWEIIDGLTIDATANDESTDIPLWWTNDQQYFADTGATGMSKLCDARNLGPTDYGYAASLMPNLPFGFIPRTVGASDSTKARFHYWQYPDNSNGWRVPLVASHAFHGPPASPLALYMYYGASQSDGLIGARVAC